MLSISYQRIEKFYNGRFHQHLKDVISVKNASHATIDELYMLWSKATIPTVFKVNAIEKLKKLHENWLLLKKNKGRPSHAQKTQEQEFINQLDMLCDVAHADALTTIQQQDDRLFLEDQRSVTSMIIGPEDKKFTTKQKGIEQRRMKEEKRRIKGERRQKQQLFILTRLFFPVY